MRSLRDVARAVFGESTTTETLRTGVVLKTKARLEKLLLNPEQMKHATIPKHPFARPLETTVVTPLTRSSSLLVPSNHCVKSIADIQSTCPPASYARTKRKL